MPEGDEFLRTNKKKFQTIFQIQDKLFLDRQNTRLNILWYHSKGSPDNTTYGTKSCITEVAHLCKYPRIKTEMKPGEKKIKKCRTNKMQYKTKKQLFYPSAVSTDSSKISCIYHNLHYLFEAIQFMSFLFK